MLHSFQHTPPSARRRDVHAGADSRPRTGQSHTGPPSPRALAPLSAAPQAHHSWALTATRPHAHSHACRPRRSRDTALAAPRSSLGRRPAWARLPLSTRQGARLPGFGSSPEVGASSAAIAPGKCSPEPRQRSGSGLRLCKEGLLSNPGGYCPVSFFGPLLVLLVGLGALSARTLGCRSTGRFTEANHGAGVSGSHRQAPSVQMQLPDSGHRELTSSWQERRSVVGMVAGVGCAGAVGQH